MNIVSMMPLMTDDELKVLPNPSSATGTAVTPVKDSYGLREFGADLKSAFQIAGNSFANSASSMVKQSNDEYMEDTKTLMKYQDELNDANADKAWDRQQQLANDANAFTTSEREASQEFYQTLSDTAYQRAVEDLRKAGINPALVGSLGGASASAVSGVSGSTGGSPAASSVSGSSASRSDYVSAKKADEQIIRDIFGAIAGILSDGLSSATKLITHFV